MHTIRTRFAEPAVGGCLSGKGHHEGGCEGEFHYGILGRAEGGRSTNQYRLSGAGAVMEGVEERVCREKAVYEGSGQSSEHLCSDVVCALGGKPHSRTRLQPQRTNRHTSS